MKREDDERLWDLLGEAGVPEVSPFFAANILRQIRQQRDWRAVMRDFWSFRSLAPLSGLATVAVAAAFLIGAHGRSPGTRSSSAEAAPVGLAAQDYEVVAHLDELLASEENSLWTDSSSL